MTLWEPKMCCCFELRTGSIILGVVFLVGGCFSLLGGIQSLVMSNEEIEALCIDNDIDNREECMAQYGKFELGIISASMVIACFHIIFSILLLYGILKQKTSFFIPLMIIYAVQIGIMILISVIMIVLLLVFGSSFPIFLIAAGICGGTIFLETYFLLVLRAHYYEIKRAKGQIHMTLNEQNPEAPPYSGSFVLPPPYPGNEAPPYPGSDAPLYPDTKKLPE